MDVANDLKDRRWESMKRLADDFFSAFAAFFSVLFSVVFVPMMYSRAGMDFIGCYSATVIFSAISTFCAGHFANIPLIIVPSIALNGYLAYCVIISKGIPWQDALGLYLIASAIFALLVLSNLRDKFVDSFPPAVKKGLMAGIGIFIAVFALMQGHLIMPSPVTLVTLGDLADPMAYLSLVGLVLAMMLSALKVRGAFFYAMMFTAVLAFIEGSFEIPRSPFMLPINIDKVSVSVYFGYLLEILDMGDSGDVGEILTIILTIFSVMVFETMGVISPAVQSLNDENINKEDAEKKSLIVSAFSSAIGILAGAVGLLPSMGTFVTSRTAANRSKAAKIASFLFLIALFCAPTVKAIAEMPAIIVPPLVMAGAMLFFHGASFAFEKRNDVTEILPAFLTMVAIPFSYSIADGIGIGIISYVVLKATTKHWKEINALTIFFAIIWLIHYIF